MNRPTQEHAAVKGAPQLPLRPVEEVMRLARMGAFFPTRISFMRVLLRTLAAEQAQVTRPVWCIDDEGYGHAVYSLTLHDHTYSLVAFATKLAPEQRTDRVIAEAWDTTCVLFDGVPDAADIERLAEQAPKQEAGRFLPSELVLSRANKSVRLFQHVVESLAEGVQPDESMIRSIGYLQRTTAVYGNGKFGIADRDHIVSRPALSGPFQVELLCVWLIRGFTLDLVEHVARRRTPETFVPLEPRLRRYLGIGNSTGLGMAPFLVSHPTLINNWMMARETAIARVCAVEHASAEEIAHVLKLITRVRQHLLQWNVDDERQMSRIRILRDEFDVLTAEIDVQALQQGSPWHSLVKATSGLSLECQELIVALILEPYAHLVDGLSECMGSTTRPQIDPAMRVAQLRELIRKNWNWALALDFSTDQETRQFWYVSEEKLEPRLGLRHEEPGAELELPLDVARQVQKLYIALEPLSHSMTMAALLLQFPEFRHAIARIQTQAHYPYAEIRDNLIGEQCLPIDMLRCKLSFFGASKFDPRSDRWTRITLYQGAPSFDELSLDNVDDWWLPVLEARQD